MVGVCVCVWGGWGGGGGGRRKPSSLFHTLLTDFVMTHLNSFLSHPFLVLETEQKSKMARQPET